MRDSASVRVLWGDPQPLTQTDLGPYLIQIQQHINDLFINREGINHMTVTTEDTTKTVTLDTPDGTIIRLIDGSQTHADEGALAVVDRSRPTDESRYLPVSWLKGHVKDGMSQMDGGYSPETFEVFDFQVGDRVRVIGSTFEFGHEGVISAVPATNGDDCIVAVDFPYDRNLSYLFDRLEKVEIPDPLAKLRDLLMEGWEPLGYTEDPEPEDDCCASYYEEEPLAEWEKELLGEPVAFEAGDLVVIGVTTDHGFNVDSWNGLRCRVLSEGSLDGDLFVQPLEERPDQYGTAPFNWARADFRAFEPSRDFRVGDLVESDRYGVNGEPAKAVVTRLDGEFGGDIEVRWTEGLSTLVAYGPLGARRMYLTLTGVHVEPEPVIETFEYEAGQEIDPEAASDLPDGTVLVVENGVLVTAFVGESA